MPRGWSWSAFVAANVVIDLESLYYLTRHEYPVHRQLHTFVGATFAGLATVLALLLVRRPRVVRTWFEGRSPAVRAEATPRGIAVGGMAGAVSHPVLDGIMHGDIEPFQPWTAANPLHGTLSLSALHLACAIAGLVGAALLATWAFRSRADGSTGGPRRP